MMRWVMTFLVGSVAVGCNKSRSPVAAPVASAAPQHLSTNVPTTAPAQVAPALKPYVLHLPGVSGTSVIDHSLRDGLRAGGFDGTLDIYDWTCRDPGIPALHNRVRNEEQAQLVADRLTEQFRKFPQVPIYLVCHSGGSGPATWALERLPADVRVSCFVMLAPALSPTYDLSRALARVSGSCYSFHSTNDDLVLGTGTRLFGTIDGVRVDAAGRVGFVKPDGADAAQYAKLVQKPYDATWGRLGHIGGHVGCMGTPFVQAVVAPLMLGREAAAELLNKSVAQPLPDVLWPK